MRVVIGAVVVLHLLGAAAIIGPWLAAPRSGRIRMAMVWGARAQVVTGIVLVGLHEMSSDPADALNRTKIGVKLLVALACAACAEIANGRQRRARAAASADGGGGTATATLPATGLVQATALLAILNVCVAVLWT
ncbi:MAG TPA: hypothetical protein VFT68_14775 [Lapillicoccus sp.]|nr:hypothetical protein [Lapillicoccus sp.]